jgi:hypothetical protein
MTNEKTDVTTGQSKSDETALIDRRDILVSAAAMAGAGSLGVVVGSSGVAAAPTGTFPTSSDDPLLKIRADRIRLIGRTSDPSSPDDGTIWYRSDL